MTYPFKILFRVCKMVIIFPTALEVLSLVYKTRFSMLDREKHGKEMWEALQGELWEAIEEYIHGD